MREDEKLDFSDWVGKHYTEVEIRYNPLAPSHRFLLVRPNQTPTIRTGDRVDVYTNEFGYIEKVEA